MTAPAWQPEGLTLPCFTLTGASCPSLGLCSPSLLPLPSSLPATGEEKTQCPVSAARGLGQATEAAGILSCSGDSQSQLLAQLWEKESGYLHCPSLLFLSDSLALPQQV